ncbi:hypothetical protein BOTBODRAFT_188719 [Botryobasidium botryosum FD-172 SS1]|uniref:Uncharacterized protein n=1 Tax=Botryobasidium botryosum (strain FD-172 SS1) TaxID=930990 RepID=A0A067MC99_BOTB1|nr:hypothetical protein BOTBODRAFT_188719 [Botryobasidium botryosum FD-172 SS1]
MLASIIAVALAATGAMAAHTINFSSNCPSAIMQLPGRGNYGPGSYTFNGDVNGGIASAGRSCSQDGVPCSSVEFTLNGGYSTGDITLIPPHQYSARAAFQMTPGGSSAVCDNANCGRNNAFFKFDDYSAQRYDSNPNAGINIQITC